MEGDATARVAPISGSAMSEFEVKGADQSAGCLSTSRLKVIACVLGLLLLVAVVVIVVLLVQNTQSARPGGPCPEGHCGGHGSCLITKQDGGDYNTTCVCDVGYVGGQCKTALDGWGVWGAWSDCYLSRSCGLDTRTRQRACYKDGRTESDPSCSGQATSSDMCTYTACPGCLNHPNVTGSANYSLPYSVSGMVDTSSGDLAVVERFGNRSGIFSRDGRLIRSLTVPADSSLWGIGRQADKLFIVNYGGTNIHILKEDNGFISTMETGIKFARIIVIKGNTAWLTSSRGLHELTFDADYKLTNSKLLKARDFKQFNLPIGLAVLERHIVVSCFDSHNVHYLARDGSALFPPVGIYGTGDGQLLRPIDVTTDTCGRTYVAAFNHRVHLFSDSGRFLQTLFAEQDGLDGNSFTIFYTNDSLFITTGKPHRLYVLKL